MSSRNLQHYIPAELANKIGLNEMTEAQRSHYLFEMQTLIMEASLLQYMNKESEDEQSIFMSWLQAHKNDKELWSKLYQTFPVFKEILETEIDRFLNHDPALIRH